MSNFKADELKQRTKGGGCPETKSRSEAASVWERLRKTPHKPSLLSLFLSHARSIVNKMGELGLQLEDNRLIRGCYVVIISESWLHPAISDAAVELTPL